MTEPFKPSKTFFRSSVRYLSPSLNLLICLILPGILLTYDTFLTCMVNADNVSSATTI